MKVIKKIVALILLMCYLFIVEVPVVKAVDATAEISLNKSDYHVGDQVTATIAIKQSGKIGGVQFDFSFDKNAFSYVSATQSTGWDTPTINDMNVSNGSLTFVIMPKDIANGMSEGNVISVNLKVISQPTSQSGAIAATNFAVNDPDYEDINVGNVSKYVKITPQVYHLTIKPNGGTYEGKTTDKTINDIKAGQTVVVADAVPPQAYTVTLDYNGGDHAKETLTQVNKFKEWSYSGITKVGTTTGGTEFKYQSSNATLTAQYVKGAVTLPTETTRTDYIFDGWYTTADDTGTKVGTSYTPTANTTLYAHWLKSELYLKSTEYKIGENDVTKYEKEDSMVTGILPETTAKALKEGLESNGTIKILTKDNKEVADDALVGTGMIIQVSNTLGDTIKLNAVVIGDISGDGEVLIDDLTTINQVVLQEVELDDITNKAADIDKDKEITLSDLVTENDMVLKNIEDISKLK